MQLKPYLSLQNVLFDQLAESRSINILEQVTDRTGKPTVLKSDWTESNELGAICFPDDSVVKNLPAIQKTQETWV